MHRRFAIGVFFASHVLGAWAADPSGLASDKQKFSYAIGHQIAQNIKSRGFEVDAKALIQAINDELSGQPPKLSSAEMQAAFVSYQQKRMEALATKNKEAGNAFLTANKKKDGVTVLPSGLQYKVIEVGKGQKPKAADTVVVHYRGTLINGEEFDSSYTRGEPATFQLAGIIQGWQEALQLMTTGSKWEVYMPPELAYGTRGAGDAIGPNETLIFQIELIDIKQKQ